MAFYVYLHKDILGNVFYVGRCSNAQRAYSKHRPNYWKDVTRDGYSVTLLCCESFDESVELEQFLLDEIPSLLNVKRKSDERLDYSKVDWNSFVFMTKALPPTLEIRSVTLVGILIFVNIPVTRLVIVEK